MSYSKQTWADTGVAPDGRFTADRGNYMEQGIFDAGSKIDASSQTGTAYTLALSDAGNCIELSNAGAITLTIPPNSSVAFPVGTVIEINQMGAGQVTITPGSGVTLRSRGAALKIAGQYGVAGLRKRATDEWVVTGDLVT